MTNFAWIGRLTSTDIFGIKTKKFKQNFDQHGLESWKHHHHQIEKKM